MKNLRYDDRFFSSTRGRIVLLLRNTGKTVNELSAALGLTDNAVRAHLLSLERDHLVEAGGTIKGFRKPHYLYRLTAEARHIFPKAYDSLLNRLLDVLKRRMPEATLETVLHDVGKDIGESKRDENLSLDQRVEAALETLEELGGSAVVERSENCLMIKSEGCPFADAVVEHPEICHVAESMIQEIVGKPVRETCERSSMPKCRFAIENAA